MKVEIACIIDRSGSMYNLVNDSIGGFNAFLDAQKEVEGQAKFTLVMFSDEHAVIHDGVDINEVPNLSLDTFTVGGSTALYDAVGATINSIGARLNASEDKPDKVIIAILTDGEENSSREFTHDKIADMIKHQQAVYSWEFIFLAANQDAFAVGSSLNIKQANTMNFDPTSGGVGFAYATVRGLVTEHRTK